MNIYKQSPSNPCMLIFIIYQKQNFAGVYTPNLIIFHEYFTELNALYKFIIFRHLYFKPIIENHKKSTKR